MYRLFAIRDLKAKTFTQLITDRNSAQAERGFKTAINNKDTDYGKYPEDFQLFEMGSYDPDTGHIVPHPAPLLVVEGTTVKTNIM